ncbi:MAG: hypothetical protein WDA27_07920 [Actinomycetota bacterium]
MAQPEERVDRLAEPTTKAIEAAKDILEHVEIVDVRSTSISASVVDSFHPGAPVEQVTFNVSSSYAAEQGAMGNRFEFEFTLLGPDGDFFGEVKFTIVVDYAVPDDYEPDRDGADFIASTTGYFAAYPYARELLQSVSARLHLDPLVLGLLRRGSMQPGRIGSVNLAALRAKDAS